MKVGIVTICDYLNYGNRLQNYASQEVIKSLGYEVETIVNTPLKIKDLDKNIYEKILYNTKNNSFKKIISKIKKKTQQYLNKKKLDDKKRSFLEFTNEYIKETDYIINRENIPSEEIGKFDYFIVGSDQVWNPNFRYGNPIDFLTFAPKHKRIAYAPSFGTSHIPDQYINNYKRWLTEFKSLSVREVAGAEVIKKLTGRESLVLIDPTLMLTKEKWLSISKTSNNKPHENFLLTYFLGEIPKDKEKLIKEIAINNQMKIVNLANFKDEKYFSVCPREFIDLINSSTLFITDSFHGVVFSILLEKQFIVIERVGEEASMNSRMDTILTKFGFESRKWNIVDKKKELFSVDFNNVSIILKTEREKTYSYLKEAIKA